MNIPLFLLGVVGVEPKRAQKNHADNCSHSHTLLRLFISGAGQWATMQPAGFSCIHNNSSSRLSALAVVVYTVHKTGELVQHQQKNLGGGRRILQVCHELPFLLFSCVMRIHKHEAQGAARKGDGLETWPFGFGRLVVFRSVYFAQSNR